MSADLIECVACRCWFKGTEDFDHGVDRLLCVCCDEAPRCMDCDWNEYMVALRCTESDANEWPGQFDQLDGREWKEFPQ